MSVFASAMFSTPMDGISSELLRLEELEEKKKKSKKKEQSQALEIEIGSTLLPFL